MTRDELVKLFESSDLHGLLLLVAREWLDRYYPNAEHSMFITDVGEDRPPVQIVILALAA